MAPLEFIFGFADRDRVENLPLEAGTACEGTAGGG